MRLHLSLVLTALPLFVLAGKFHEFQPLRARHGGRFGRHPSPTISANTPNATSDDCDDDTPTTNSTSKYKLVDFYQGESFLNDWNFFSSADPTHGNVNYQTKDNAIAKKLAFVDANGAATLAVDDFSNVAVGGKRDSVRISSKKKYNNGLFIADFFSMPHGCSVWPAYWSVGPNWPSAGEIDILEGVHEQPTNQYTLHTSAGCQLSVNKNEPNVRSNVINTQCASSGNDNRGCAFSDPDPESYGHEFNMISGGVFAHLWDSNGIKIWRFSRPNIPADIAAKNPDPSKWGTPVANFPSTNCDMASHFFEHNLVIDTTLCGDFGGPTYSSSGCPGTCEQAVANPDNFKFAKWRINYISVYSI
ncbi:hypothetical protein D9613_007004 [Agrocybe pediades]|uniref:GH16 domain-containing protein n=1 Tax=Agrocybe pediades TaxID=84607 RepID=A0A8H4VK65_9AGAR|nr:hypothetical protein D9613_007004 [Agrocybe pediades]